jgi:hypothetical protein
MLYHHISIRWYNNRGSTIHYKRVDTIAVSNLARIPNLEQNCTNHITNVTQTFFAIGQQSAEIYSGEELPRPFIAGTVSSGQWPFSLSVGPAMLVNANFGRTLFDIQVGLFLLDIIDSRLETRGEILMRRN